MKNERNAANGHYRQTIYNLIIFRLLVLRSKLSSETVLPRSATGETGIMKKQVFYPNYQCYAIDTRSFLLWALNSRLLLTSWQGVKGSLLYCRTKFKEIRFSKTVGPAFCGSSWQNLPEASHSCAYNQQFDNVTI